MAGYFRYTALLDACVLYPIAIADSLLSLAVAGFYAAKWTAKIEDEWIAALEKNRPDLRGRLGTRRDSMRSAIPDWEVKESAWLPVEESLIMPDLNDRHVLAAAITGHADCIVTTNLKHFPESVLFEFGVEAIDPDTFIVNQWDLDPVTAISAFKQMRARRKRPNTGAADFSDYLERAGLPATAHRLRDASELI